MSDVPPEGPSQPGSVEAPGRKRIEALAKASWAAPLIALVLGFVSKTTIQDSAGQFVVAAVQMIFILAGLVCGVIALCMVKRYGWKKILLPALTGIIIVLAFGAAAAIALPTIRKVAQEKRAAAAEQLLKAQSFQAPAGFSEFPDGKKQKDVIYSYVKGAGEGIENCIVLQVEDLGGTIGKGDLASHLAGQPNVSAFKEKWNGWDIDVVRVKETVSGVDTITFNAQVPLLPRALQVKVCGTEKKETELRVVLQQALANLKGVTNWK